MTELDTRDPAMLDAVADLALSLDVRHVPADQRTRGGFLSLPLTFGPNTVAQLATLPSVVARGDAGAPVGFMLASEPVADSPSPIVRQLLLTFARSAHGHRNCALYGPVGVAASHQGQGLAATMFADLLKRMQGSGKEVLVGFVDTSNVPSLGLHTHKLGFEVIGQFEVQDRQFVAIMFDRTRVPSELAGD
jgi:ribosomal protein S18 acetylase RimI-like enzyme